MFVRVIFLKRRNLTAVVAGLFTMLFIFASVNQTASADLYKKGSSGQIVLEIQKRLKEWGYYDGRADGAFGTATEKAVKLFQQKNGLTADGQVGDATLAALGINTAEIGQSNTAEGDLQLLARLISAEARGEPYIGQVAVGAVVLNRVEHPSFPNTLADVIYQTDAFTCLYDGQFDEPIAESAYRAAQEALDGNDPSYGALYYFNPVTATSQWIWSRPLIVTIGKHRFCS